jgi:hypothetical protein
MPQIVLKKGSLVKVQVQVEDASILCQERSGNRARQLLTVATLFLLILLNIEPLAKKKLQSCTRRSFSQNGLSRPLFE